MENEVNTSGLRLLIITGEDPANDDIKRLERAARQRGHRPRVVSWNELSVALDDRGPRLCAGGVPLEVDGIIHQMSTDALDGLIILGAVEEDVPHINSVDAVLRSADKFATHVRLVAHGVPTPPTAFCPNDHELRLFARDYGYPVVLKQPDGARGAEVTLARGEDELLAKAASIRDRGTPLLVQRFIAEAAGINHRVIVIGGAFVAAVEQTGGRPGDFRSNGPGDVCRPVTLTEEEIDIVERAARAAELDLMSADLLRSEDGPVILETNSFPAFGGFDHVDLCAHILDVIERKVREHVPLVLPQAPSSEEILVAEVEEELAIHSGKGRLAASAVRDDPVSAGEGPFPAST
ncbi:putative alpha-L-glutamate ligase [Planobispora rosea]|uniref:Putative alpha-L-glutamate ligase n=1 Tax=Planobispora rosea TaxID=35762 RepID=A0A8J3S6C4_PLARO|nr:putative alpha-L-glutamate ligase [Planobispora rosea]GIH89126.1 putative alpha-L-glutamate ligase [Planobispora rosea]